MKGHISNQNGDVLIDNEVMAKYAGSAAVENFGIVGMAAVNMKDGLVKLLKKESLYFINCKVCADRNFERASY